MKYWKRSNPLQCNFSYTDCVFRSNEVNSLFTPPKN